jgi:hypothetical protein
MGRCLPNHTLSERGPSAAFSATVTSRLLGGTQLRLVQRGGLKAGRDRCDRTPFCAVKKEITSHHPENRISSASRLGTPRVRESSWRAIGSILVRWSSRVCKPLDRNCDSTPDRRTSVIALCFKLWRRAPRLALRAKLDGTPVGLRFGGVSVAVDHQHRDTPDVDLPYHARKVSKASVSKFLTEENWASSPAQRNP